MWNAYNLTNIVIAAWELLIRELLFLESGLPGDGMGHETSPPTREWSYLIVGDPRLSLEIVWGLEVSLKSHVSFNCTGEVGGLRSIPRDFMRLGIPTEESYQSKITLERWEIRDKSLVRLRSPTGESCQFETTLLVQNTLLKVIFPRLLRVVQLSMGVRSDQWWWCWAQVCYYRCQDFLRWQGLILLLGCKHDLSKDFYLVDELLKGSVGQECLQ